MIRYGQQDITQADIDAVIDVLKSANLTQGPNIPQFEQCVQKQTGAKHEIVGIRPGERLHEQMIGTEDALYTYEYFEHFKILSAIHNWDNDPNHEKVGKI